MKEGHHREESILFVESQPTADLARVCDHVAVSEQASLRFACRAGGVNYDRVIILCDIRMLVCFSNTLRCFRFVLKRNNCFEAVRLISNELNNRQELDRKSVV